MRLLLRWAISAFAIFLVPYIVPGVSIRNFWTALVAALVVGFVDILIKPILLLFPFPINITPPVAAPPPPPPPAPPPRAGAPGGRPAGRGGSGGPLFRNNSGARSIHFGL